MATPGPTRSARVGRAGAGVAAAELAALAAHLGGGAAPPSPLVVAAVAVLCWPVACLLVGRRPTLLRQAAVVALAQLALHAVFDAGAGPMPGHAAMTPGPGMLAAHAAAWLATVLAWRFGERAVAVLLAPLRPGRVPEPAAPPRTAPAPLPPRATPARRPAPVLAGAPRRGPPRAA